MHCTGTFDDHDRLQECFHQGVPRRCRPSDHLVDGDHRLSFAVISSDSGSLWGQLHQALQGVCGLAFGTGFQHFAHGDQGQDHGCGFKIEFHAYNAMTAAPESPSDLGFGHGEECVGAAHEGCARIPGLPECPCWERGARGF